VSTALIRISGLDAMSLEVRSESAEVRDDALALASSITSITDPMEDAEAANALRGLNEILREVERARKAVKEPVLAISRKIDETARTFIAEVLDEKDRLEMLRGKFLSEAGQEAAGDKAVIRDRWRFEVANIEQLFAAHPELCRIEPDGEKIRELLKTTQVVPGLRVWQEVKAGVR
jgi:hypothetical protein